MWGVRAQPLPPCCLHPSAALLLMTLVLLVLLVMVVLLALAPVLLLTLELCVPLRQGGGAARQRTGRPAAAAWLAAEWRARQVEVQGLAEQGWMGQGQGWACQLGTGGAAVWEGGAPRLLPALPPPWPASAAAA